MDITYRSDFGILSVEPTGALEEKDFENLTTEIESIQKDERELNGVLIHTKEFPGYKRFSDVLAHGKFVLGHRGKIEKVAICTDSTVGNLLELLGKTFIGASVRKFDYDKKDEAEKWILS